ncbi:hypothetical protein LCGC14_1549940 [marine sediment metagenome]|uniref:4Fe-4S ferredoxin-type domain-containing protein n=1 Tax=marine sediment metagenome TaxID=412755 RepID=A0A0F9LRE0_9ZZZZ
MSLIKFDMELCSHCGACAFECPVRIIKLVGGNPSVVEERAPTCIHCGHCVCVCPDSALTHEDYGPADCPLSGEAPSEADIERIIRRRRSVRAYKNKPVERDVMEKLIRIARYGPTASNSQLVGWIAIDNREGVKEVSDHVIQWMAKLVKWRHPAARKGYDFKRLIEAYEAGLDVITRRAPALVITHAPKSHHFGVIDSTIALTSMDIAAPSLGLGTCWGGFIMAAAGDHKPLQKHVGIPKGHVFTGAMMIGYPKYEYHRLPQRNEPQITWLGGTAPI